MAYDPITSLLNLADKALDKFASSPAEKAEMQIKLQELAQKGDLEKLNVEVKLLLGQIETNKLEASSDSFFKGGWRPSVGWTCSFGLAMQVLIYPIVQWYLVIIGSTAVLPTIEFEQIMALLVPLLGIGGYRTYEKTKKAA